MKSAAKTTAASTMKLLLKPMERQERDIFCVGNITTKYFHPISKILGAVGGGMMPPEKDNVPTTVCMTTKNYWYRSFGGCFLNSRWLTNGEQVGPFTFVVDIIKEDKNPRSDGAAVGGSIEYVHTKTLLFNMITIPTYIIRIEEFLNVHKEPNNNQWDLVVNGYMFNSLLFNEKGIMRRVAENDDNQGCSTQFYRNLHHVLLFDGSCVLCDNSVNFVINRDARRLETGGTLPLFKVASIQSDAGQRFIETECIDRAIVKDLKSILLVKSTGEVYTHSDAVLQIAKDLAFPWSVLGYVGFLVPKRIRNVVYNFVARNRIQWFGSKQSCSTDKASKTSYL